MNRWFCLTLTLFLCCSIYSQEKIKYRKLTYSDFKSEFGYNDTSLVVMDIYFDKKENSAYGEMSFLPITVGLIFVPNFSIIGVATTAISLPIFVHGSYTLIKYSKRNLHKTLSKYNETKKLPKWLQKRVDKQLTFYKEIERGY